jgi:hypothetical protein
MRAVGWLISSLVTVYERHISFLEIRHRSLLDQLSRLMREYALPENGRIISRANIILTMQDHGFL